MKKTLLLFGQLFCAFIVLQAQPSFLALTEQGARFGTISKYDIVTNTISVAHAIETKGAFSSSNMVKAADGKFYGTTRDGGKGYGIIFSFDASSSAYTVVKKFDLTNGGYPGGSLIQAADGKLYGMTQQGGIFNYGVIFSFDPTTATYLVLHSFDLINGRNPNGSLLQASDGKLYGMTVNGGTSDQGVLFFFDPTSSSYTVEKNFNNTDGINPFGSLIQVSDGKLYGMTRGGGSSNYGVIFSFDPSSSSYAVLKNFDQTNGANPFNSLMQAFNGKLYAMTSGGGLSDAGVIFSFDPSNSEYLVLKHFNNSDGGKPYGSLIQISNGTLYGMTLQGGTSNNGIIFSFDPTSSSYNVIHNFDLTNGGGPYFNDVQLNTDGKLYGMTHGGGVHRWGVIFSFDLSTNQYNKLVDIGENHGFYPQGTLCRAFDGKFYGVTSGGGSLGYGVIFSFDLATSTYSVVKNFDLANGSNPTGSLTQASDGKLYGMTRFGGASNAGVIFSFDPSTSIYSVLKNFNNTTGASPFGALMQASNGKFYGLTYRGGSLGAGVIFSFDPITFEYTVLKNFQLTDGSYPYGSLIQASNGKFYGMTNQGGSTYQINYNDPFNIVQSPGYGVIFSFNPVNSAYEVVRNFDLADGGNPYGSLVNASNGRLYGLTNQGGTTNDGVMFSFDPASSAYNVEKYFNYTDGSQPYGSLIQASDDKLYGMTRFGGALNAGIIFSFNPATNDYTKKDFDKANGANPQFSDLIEIKNIQLNCVANTTADAAEGSCSAIVSQIDPQISPAGSAVNYTLTGATTGNGTGTASGLSFNVGTTMVTYTSTDDPSKACSFTVTVNPTSVFYQDADTDGYGNAAETIYACTQPAGYVQDNTDCNDNNASVHLAITYYRDADNDGFGDPSSSVSLCQLAPPSGYVTNNSDCDDGQKLYQDSDGDGYGSTILVACGGVTSNTDCNDNNPAIHAPATYYRDADNDGYGNILDAITLCAVTPPAGYVVNSTDCDDSQATTHPGVTEICNNGIDDNCNGQADEGCPVGIPSITINDVSVSESNGVAVLTVSLSNASVSDITIGYSTLNGTATSGPRGKKGADYIAATGNITVPAGNLSATIRITINADDVVESPENFTVKLSLNKANAKKATISDGTGVVTILDGSGNRLFTNNKNITGLDQKLNIRALPNPSATYFTIVTQSKINKPISLVVYDISGRLIETKYDLPANYSISIGHNYKPGLYNVEIMQGNQKQTLKLVKGSQ